MEFCTQIVPSKICQAKTIKQAIIKMFIYFVRTDMRLKIEPFFNVNIFREI